MTTTDDGMYAYLDNLDYICVPNTCVDPNILANELEKECQEAYTRGVQPVYAGKCLPPNAPFKLLDCTEVAPVPYVKIVAVSICHTIQTV